MGKIFAVASGNPIDRSLLLRPSQSPQPLGRQLRHSLPRRPNPDSEPQTPNAKLPPPFSALTFPVLQPTLRRKFASVCDWIAKVMNQFKSLRASTLYCQKCRATHPVRERLLLILPDREIYDYLCTNCGSSVGSREVRSSQESGLIVP